MKQDRTDLRQAAGGQALAGWVLLVVGLIVGIAATAATGSIPVAFFAGWMLAAAIVFALAIVTMWGSA